MIDRPRLIINADDLGLTAGVTRGIIEAHHAGVVTSASLLATGSAFEDAVALLADVPSLAVGVHLDFVAGRPLTPAPSLVDARHGRFHSLARLARHALLGRIRAQDVADETTAQIERVRAAGITPTHVDSHRHAHLLPALWRPIAQAAIGAGLRVVRCPTRQLTGAAGRGGAGGVVRTVALRAAARYAARRGPRVVHADHFAGPALQGRPGIATLLLRLIEQLPPGTTELMVHPGRVDAELRAVDSYVAPRERELDALLSREVRDRLRLGDVSLVSFAALARSS